MENLLQVTQEMQALSFEEGRAAAGAAASASASTSAEEGEGGLEGSQGGLTSCQVSPEGTSPARPCHLVSTAWGSAAAGVVWGIHMRGVVQRWIRFLVIWILGAVSAFCVP